MVGTSGCWLAARRLIASLRQPARTRPDLNMNQRLLKVEIAQKIDRKIGFGVYTLLGGVMLTLPGAIHIVSINGTNQMDDLNSKLEAEVKRLQDSNEARHKDHEERLAALEGERSTKPSSD